MSSSVVHGYISTFFGFYEYMCLLV